MVDSKPIIDQFARFLICLNFIKWIFMNILLCPWTSINCHHYGKTLRKPQYIKNKRSFSWKVCESSLNWRTVPQGTWEWVMCQMFMRC